VWAIDFQFDETDVGRLVKISNVADEYTREALADYAIRTVSAAGTMFALDQIHQSRSAPQFMRMDNGPEFIAYTQR
jgi:putative transposase